MATQTDRQPALIRHLYELAGASAGSGTAHKPDRAALAALRRGLGPKPGTQVKMFPHVTPFIPEDAGRSHREAYYVVAALFGLYSRPWTPAESQNFGWSAAEVARRAERREPVERRLTALLDAEWEDLPTHLRGFVSLMKDAVPVDWTRLLRDLRAWGHPDRYVQQGWARAYWSPPHHPDTNEPAETEATTKETS